MIHELKLKDLFYNSLGEKISPLLKQQGFSCKRNKTWNRIRNRFVDVIEIDINPKTATAHSFSFTVNCGIVVPEIDKIIWDDKNNVFFSEVEGLIRMRAGEIILDFFSTDIEKKSWTDIWWNIDSRENIDKIVDEIATLIMVKEIPFLDRFDSLESIELFVSNKGRLNRLYAVQKMKLSILKILLGKTADGIELLEKVVGKTGAWFEKGQMILRKLGLEQNPTN
jgi:hypothetical protein